MADIASAGTAAIARAAAPAGAMSAISRGSRHLREKLFANGIGGIYNKTA